MGPGDKKKRVCCLRHTGCGQKSVSSITVPSVARRRSIRDCGSRAYFRAAYSGPSFFFFLGLVEGFLSVWEGPDWLTCPTTRWSVAGGWRWKCKDPAAQGTVHHAETESESATGSGPGETAGLGDYTFILLPTTDSDAEVESTRIRVDSSTARGGTVTPVWLGPLSEL